MWNTNNHIKKTKSISVYHFVIYEIDKKYFISLIYLQCSWCLLLRILEVNNCLLNCSTDTLVPWFFLHLWDCSKHKYRSWSCKQTKYSTNFLLETRKVSPIFKWGSMCFILCIMCRNALTLTLLLIQFHNLLYFWFYMHACTAETTFLM